MQTTTETPPRKTMPTPPIDRELTLTHATFVHGVSHDGRRVWAAVDDGDLIAFDPETGRELARHPCGADAGVAFDGQALWVICGEEIRRMDPETGAVLARIPAPERGEVSGMAYAEGFLWIGQYRKQAVLKVDPRTGEVLKRVSCDRFVTGVSFADGEVWYGSVSGDDARPAGMLHRADPATLAERARYAYDESMWISGLEVAPEGDRFWAGGHKDGKVRVLRRPDRQR